MRNMLAITVLMVGLAGGALAQDYPGSPDAPLTGRHTIHRQQERT